ncbi:PilN domain-containing protein [Pseudogracilibacillus auburnensis]|uniref:PilN domain-containing protein n=1 Tax=Pseudogracilibacillus auburnensis TaxID=1494959 RepID=UPI001A962462|nr:hypothetical protein [Pseudogracilibacillus auburnensis]MBO1005599.1 hypothetical protein [Pseudogracilibacillus auburnensis]
MLIDINLLQVKEKKRSHLFFIIIMIVSVTLLLSGIFIYQAHNKKATLKHVTTEIETTRQLREAKEQSIDVKGSVHSIKTLQSAITWAEQNQLSAVHLISTLTQLLPQEGYINNFDYQYDFIDMTAEFPYKKQAAYYLARLNQSDWVDDAMILSITTTGEGKTTSSEVKYMINLNLSVLRSAGREQGDAS